MPTHAGWLALVSCREDLRFSSYYEILAALPAEFKRGRPPNDDG
jgi:hypothetical protein